SSFIIRILALPSASLQREINEQLLRSTSKSHGIAIAAEDIDYDLGGMKTTRLWGLAGIAFVSLCQLTRAGPRDGGGVGSGGGGHIGGSGRVGGFAGGASRAAPAFYGGGRCEPA